jgi:hypothetical protein
MKEKIKKVVSDVAVFLLIRWEQFSCSAEMQQTLIFWPLRLLVLRAACCSHALSCVPLCR